MSFYLGCAIWSYKNWVGSLFPPKSQAADFLKLYAERFTCVEGNTTFYATPEEETVKRWAEQTPKNFRFYPKMSRTVSHSGRLMPRRDEALFFLQRMQHLGDRLGGIFLQLPKEYGPESFADLEKFLQRWPHADCPLSVELRHLGWYQEEHATKIKQLLRHHQTARVTLDTRPVYESDDDPQEGKERRKPYLPVQPMLTAHPTLVRYVSHPDIQRNEVYLQQWARWVAQCLQRGHEVIFFVHCPVEEQTPFVAKRFQQLLEAQQAPVPALPWNLLPLPKTQLSLL